MQLIGNRKSPYMSSANWNCCCIKARSTAY